MERCYYKYRVMLVYIGDDVNSEISNKVRAMEDEGLIKICAVIEPKGNELVLSLMGDDKNLIIDESSASWVDEQTTL